ncbi:MAG: PASTA domain-containing protein [Clostridia bacterium]|nr:PASTA domain-containing protein [Clostridia bacterium]
MAKGPTKKMLKRMFVILCVFMACFLPVSANLVRIQLVQHDFYQKKAISQQTRDKIVSPKRGTIYDRNKKPLAVSATVQTVYIQPNAVKDEQKELLIKEFTKVIDVEESFMEERIAKNNYYQIVKRQIEADMEAEVRAFIKEHKLYNCVALTEDTKRYYPYGNFASHVLGFTNIDGDGITGLEKQYNEYLTGTPGRIISAKDAKGNEMNFKYEKYEEAQDGNSLVLTIDEAIQYFTEKHLDNAVIESKVENRGCAIVMDVETGDILAMATKPDFDLNTPYEIKDPLLLAQLEEASEDEYKSLQSALRNDMWRNKAVVDTYEPGSPFKTFTCAMALDEGVATLNNSFYCNGYRQVADRVIHCWKTEGHGGEDFAHGLMNSCNPVMMDLSQRIGAESFMKYVEAFGFLDKTGIDLPGEANSIFHSLKTMGPVQLAVSSFGQTIKVTPIQLITAYTSVANDGKLVQPKIVKEIIDSDGNTVKSFDTKVIRQTISKDTANSLCSILERVVTEGTGKNAYIKGYRIGGKTGTSEKIDDKNEEGEIDKRIASFIGLAPADDPKIAVLVLLDEPNVENKNGSVVAAPVVAQIMNDVLPYLGIEQQFSEEEQKTMDVVVPNLVGYTLTKAQTELRKAGISAKVEGGESGKVTAQIPKGGTKMPKDATMVLYTNDAKPEDSVVVPDLTGMSYSQAKRELSRKGLYIKFDGVFDETLESVLISQNPAKGTVVDAGTIVTVNFRYNTNDG